MSHRPCFLLRRFVPLLALIAAGCTAPAGQKAAGPLAVSVSVPVEREVTDYEVFTGRTAAIDAVDVRARVNGYLDKVAFKAGMEVKKGDLLFVIDPRPYQAALNKAKGQITLSEARLKRGNADVNRNQPLVKTGAVSQQEFDKLIADRDEAAATLEAAKAAAETDNLNLGFTRITAPVNGRVSRDLVTEGNLVVADNTLLTTIMSQDPMYAYFDLDERTMLHIQKLIREGKVKSARESEYPLSMELANEEGFPHHGVIDFVNNQVDAGTGTMQIRATFPNPVVSSKHSSSCVGMLLMQQDPLAFAVSSSYFLSAPLAGSRVLTPKLFVRIRLPVGPPYRALMVSERALGTDQGEQFVYVVNDKDEAVRRMVKVGPLRDGLRVIREGLEAGERVVVSGLQRVRPGEKVSPRLVDMPAAPQAQAKQ